MYKLGLSENVLKLYEKWSKKFLAYVYAKTQRFYNIDVERKTRIMNLTNIISISNHLVLITAIPFTNQ